MKNATKTINIVHKKALFDYQILEKFEAGISLLGAEVKSLRNNRATLDGSFVKFMGFEGYLMNAQIFPYSFANFKQYDQQRSRRLLLHKKEILKLKQRVDADGLTVVPLRWYTKGHHIKLEIALAKGKKQFEKRDLMKKRDDKRSIERAFRGKE